MDRRAFLGTVAVGAAGGLAGCALEAPTRSEGADRPLGRSGFPADICTAPPQNDPGVYAITDPVFGEDWVGRSLRSHYVGGEHDGEVAPRPDGLPPETTVVGIEREGTPRAYPLTVLWVHEVVNDTIAGLPLLVTYCSLCRSAMVARRTVEAAETTFRATGLLWAAPRLQEAVAAEQGRVVGAVLTGGQERQVRHSGNVVLRDDATGSYWSQILARSICGPVEGTLLSQVPATISTWEEWRGTHPETSVLLPPPYSGTTRHAASVED
ncbi:MAG: DUF3179 domain-containing (seleno)protein [Haloarculaceae archaeon]